jgi:uncharacterized protein YbaR (Trm112 family)
MLSRDFLAMVRCPENRTPLALADESLIARINRAIAERRVKNRAGQLVGRRLDGGLVREDRAVLYPIVDRIPILLLDEGIVLNQLDANPLNGAASNGDAAGSHSSRLPDESP